MKDNKKNRLNMDNTIREMLSLMSDGNIGAQLAILEIMTNNPNEVISDMLLLDSMGIYGSKIYLLWNDSVKKSFPQFQKTMRAFREGRFNEKEINERLSGTYATPFL